MFSLSPPSSICSPSLSGMGMPDGRKGVDNREVWQEGWPKGLSEQPEICFGGGGLEEETIDYLVFKNLLSNVLKWRLLRSVDGSQVSALLRWRYQA